MKDRYRPISTTQGIEDHLRESYAASTSTPPAPEAGQAAWNRYSGGVETGTNLTPIGQHVGKVAAPATLGVSPATREALETPGVDSQDQWDKFARMPGEMGAAIASDREIGLPSSEGHAPQPTAPDNVVDLSSRRQR